MPACQATFAANSWFSELQCAMGVDVTFPGHVAGGGMHEMRSWHEVAIDSPPGPVREVGGAKV